MCFSRCKPYRKAHHRAGQALSSTKFDLSGFVVFPLSVIERKVSTLKDVDSCLVQLRIAAAKRADIA